MASIQQEVGPPPAGPGDFHYGGCSAVPVCADLSGRAEMRPRPQCAAGPGPGLQEGFRDSAVSVFP